jgi:hypothetical protein
VHFVRRWLELRPQLEEHVFVPVPLYNWFLQFCNCYADAKQMEAWKDAEPHEIEVRKQKMLFGIIEQVNVSPKMRARVLYHVFYAAQYDGNEWVNPMAVFSEAVRDQTPVDASYIAVKFSTYVLRNVACYAEQFYNLYPVEFAAAMRLLHMGEAIRAEQALLHYWPELARDVSLFINVLLSNQPYDAGLAPLLWSNYFARIWIWRLLVHCPVVQHPMLLRLVRDGASLGSNCRAMIGLVFPVETDLWAQSLSPSKQAVLRQIRSCCRNEKGLQST